MLLILDCNLGFGKRCALIDALTKLNPVTAVGVVGAISAILQYLPAKPIVTFMFILHKRALGHKHTLIYTPQTPVHLTIIHTHIHTHTTHYTTQTHTQ